MQAISSASYPNQPNRCACAFKINPHPHQINRCQPTHMPNQQQFKLNLQNNAKSSKVIPQGFNVGTLEHSKSIHVQTKSATVNPNTCQINQDEKTNNQNNAFHSKHILNRKNPMTNQQALCRIKSGTLASQIPSHQRQITHGQAQYMPNQNKITPKPPILYQIITIPSQIINIVAKSTPSEHLSIQCPSTSPTFQPSTYQHKPKHISCLC